MNKTSAGILTSQISDHHPYFICIESFQIIKCKNKFIKIRTNNKASLIRFKTALSSSQIIDTFNKDTMANPNENYNRLEDEIINLINIHLPTKIVKYKKHKHKKSQWITSGIVKSISFRDNLYKKLKQTPQDSQNFQNLKTNLKTYNKIL